MLALYTLIFAVAVSGASQSSVHRRVFSALQSRQTPDLSGSNIDFGSCTDQCQAIDTKNQACNFSGDFSDPTVLGCICTNDYMNTFATCINCLVPLIDNDDATLIESSLTNLVNGCDVASHPVDQPAITAVPGASSAGSVVPTASSGSASLSASPGSVTASASSGGSSPVSTSGASIPTTSGNSTAQAGNGAAGVSSSRASVWGILCVAFAALLC